MQTVTLVTGNAGKLKEYTRLLPPEFLFEAKSIDLDEIQSLNPEDIITDKVKRAYEIIGKPVMVEDVTAGLIAMNGLPGPFIKFFEQRMGRDALFQLALAHKDRRAIVACTIGYYDGKRLIIGKGERHGIVEAMRGSNGFGFDGVFVPNGQTKTYGEMTTDEKDTISHRSVAVQDLLQQLKDL